MPGKIIAAEAREDFHRYVYRHAVVGSAGLEPIRHGERDIARTPGVGHIGSRIRGA
ncbi:Uncharacterised protein [Mycobacteroides abscessus]|nr:Uncharacterised protein [Mycobacteroides abscessus]